MRTMKTRQKHRNIMIVLIFFSLNKKKFFAPRSLEWRAEQEEEDASRIAHTFMMCLFFYFYARFLQMHIFASKEASEKNERIIFRCCTFFKVRLLTQTSVREVFRWNYYYYPVLFAPHSSFFTFWTKNA